MAEERKTIQYNIGEITEETAEETTEETTEEITEETTEEIVDETVGENTDESIDSYTVVVKRKFGSDDYTYVTGDPAGWPEGSETAAGNDEAESEEKAAEDEDAVCGVQGDEQSFEKTIAISKNKVEEGAESENEDVGDETAADDQAAEEAVKKTRYGLPLDHPENEALAFKMEERRRYKENKKRRFRTRFYVITTSVAVAVAGIIISLSPIFTVDSIVVEGNSHYTAEEIINMGHASPGRNIIYHSNKQEITDYLEQNPYIKSAKVTRRLPSTLVLKVVEREEKLAFRYDDDYLIMDGEGILLKKTRNKPTTTLIEGIVVSKIKLGEKIGTQNNALFDKSLDLIRTTAAADLYFMKIDMSKESRIKAYIYDNLIVRTDYDTLITNLENGRLHLVLEKLFSDGIERGTITFEEDGSASFMPAI